MPRPYRPARRLFWKLMLALAISMGASLVGTAIYFHLSDARNKPPVDLLGLMPVAPIVAGAIAVVVTGVLLTWYLSPPLSHLGWALRRLSRGHLETRVSHLMAGRRDEITDLAHEFDRMAAQLQALTDSRRALMHDLSHELRSPLSRMQAAIGLARQSPEATGDMLVRIEREAERLDALIEELLTLHRLEAGQLREEDMARVDLVEILQAIVEDAGFEAQVRGSRVELRAGPSFVRLVHGELVYRAFENVVRNAVKYTADGTLVTVLAEAVDDGSALLVTVQDRGPGVPANRLQEIFDPFVRVEGSEQARGTGLGLAVARRAVLLHGGTIAARPREGGGLEMLIRLPRAEGEALSVP